MMIVVQREGEEKRREEPKYCIYVDTVMNPPSF
jgi:hypothetical protein